jgi:hypothetical protein
MNPSRLLPFCAGITLLLASAASLLASAPPADAHAVLDASFDAAWEATVASLRDAGYKVSGERRAQGSVSGRRTRRVGRTNEDEGARELQRIIRTEPRVGIDVRGLSEYYVTLTVRLGSVDRGKTGIDVVGQIMAVRRRRGGAGMPQPVPLTSNGVLEEEFVQRVQEQLTHGASEPTPPPS